MRSDPNTWGTTFGSREWYSYVCGRVRLLETDSCSSGFQEELSLSGKNFGVLTAWFSPEGPNQFPNASSLQKVTHCDECSCGGFGRCNILISDGGLVGSRGKKFSSLFSRDFYRKQVHSRKIVLFPNSFWIGSALWGKYSGAYEC